MLNKIKAINQNPGMIVRREVEQIFSNEILNAELELKELLNELKAYYGSNKDKALEYKDLMEYIEKTLKEERGLGLVCSNNTAKVTKCEIDLDMNYQSELNSTQRIILDRNLQTLTELGLNLNTLFERSTMSVLVEIVENTIDKKGPVAAERELTGLEKYFKTQMTEDKLTAEEISIYRKIVNNLNERIIDGLKQHNVDKKFTEQKPNQSPQTERNPEMTHAEREKARREAQSTKALGGPTGCGSGSRCIIM